MPWGRYRGRPITEIDDRTLQHYLAWERLRPELRARLEAEWQRRTGGGAYHPGGRPVLSDASRTVAYELVSAGEAALAAGASPDRAAGVRQAAMLLRSWIRTAEREATREAPKEP